MKTTYKRKRFLEDLLIGPFQIEIFFLFPGLEKNHRQNSQSCVGEDCKMYHMAGAQRFITFNYSGDD